MQQSNLIGGCYCIILIACLPLTVTANPNDPQVVDGQADFVHNGSTLTVTNSDGAAIHWQSFSIAPDETTHFNQSSSDSRVLNRVVGPDPSQLLGNLTSNGKVFLINPAGVLVGQGAKIDVAGFVASNLNLSQENFKAGNLKFEATAETTGKVENLGDIRTPAGGNVYLVGSQVSNQGIIQTPQGEIILAAGQSIEIHDSATPGVSVKVTGDNNQVTNLGQLVAQSGQIGIVGAAVKNNGIVNADQIVKDQSGRIFLKASHNLTIQSGSRISADANPVLQEQGEAGQVSLESEQGDIQIQPQTLISANGPNGGEIAINAPVGTVDLEGELQARGTHDAGGNIRVEAAQVGLAPSAVIDAGGRQAGGKVALTANNVTLHKGANLSAVGARGGKIAIVAGSGTLESAANIQAQGSQLAGGEVKLLAMQTLSQQGSITVDGKVSGGKIALEAEHIEQNGLLSASGEIDGGFIQISAKTVITQSRLGKIFAQGYAGQGGTVAIVSSTQSASPIPVDPEIPAPDPSQALIAGNILVNGRRGGKIQVLGDRVALLDDANLDANGETSGGSILIGGDYQGNNSLIQNAQATYVSSKAQLHADGGVASLDAIGDGGRIIVWSNQATRVYGTLTARGGDKGGDGGFIETSGHWLDITNITVNASAVNGKPGVWLLDPYDLTVGGVATNADESPLGVWSSGAGGSLVQATDIEARLNTGTSVILQTTGSAGDGFGSGDININADISKTAGGDANFILNAHNDINLNASIGSTAGKLDIVFNADLDGIGGGNLNLANGNLISLNANGGSIDAATENVNLASGSITIDSDMSMHNFTLSGGTLNGVGDITVTGNFNLIGNLAVISGTGKFTTQATSTLDIGTGVTQLTLDKTWFNQDTLILAGTSSYNFHIFGSGKLVNQGTVTKSLGIHGFDSIEFVNNGNVSLDGGTLSIGDSEVEHGSYLINSGSTLYLFGNHVFNSGVSITGDGALFFADAPTITVNNDFSIDGPSLHLFNALVQGSGNLTVNSDLFVQPGHTQLSGSGQFTTTGTSHIDNNVGTNSLDLVGGKHWLNQGTVLLGSSNYIGFSTGVNTFTNDGTIELSSSNSTPLVVINSGTNTFENNGVLNDTFSGNHAIDVNLAFTNTGTINVHSGVLTISAITVSDGSLGGAGDIKITDNFQVTGNTEVFGHGELQTFGLTSIDNAAPGSIHLSLTGDATWTNQGVITIGGDDFLLFGYDSGGSNVLVNALGATLNLNTTNSTPIDFYDGNHTLNNFGTLNQQASGMHAVNVEFNNAGVVNLNDGTLSLLQNGTDSGTYNVAAGAELEFANPARSLNAGSVINSSNLVTFSSGQTDFNTGASYASVATVISGFATVNFNTGNTVDFTHLTLSTGILGGNDDFEVSTAFNFNAGEVVGNGLLTTLMSATTGLAANENVYFSRNWDNYGTVNWSGIGSLSANSIGVVVNNKASGIFNVSDPGAVGDHSIFVETFNNEGSFNLSEGALLIHSAGTDSGSYTVTGTGGLQFWYSNRNFNSGSSITSSNPVSFYHNTVNFNSGSMYEVDDTLVEGATLNFSTGGTITLPGITLNYGTLGGSDDIQVSGSLQFNAGEVTGSGLFTTLASATMTLGDVDNAFFTRNWDNFGTIQWSGPGSIWANTTGVVFTNKSTGTINVSDPSGIAEHRIYADTFNNQGAVNLSSGVLYIKNGGTDTGSYTVSGSGDLQFWHGTRHFASGASVSSINGVLFNSGTFSFDNGSSYSAPDTQILEFGQLNFSTGDALNLTALTINTGELGGADDITITDRFDFNAGAWSGSGLLTTAFGVTTTLADQNNIYLDGNWTNQGSINWSAGGGIYTNISGTLFINAATGVINASDTLATGNLNLIVDTFDNQGTLNVSSGLLSIQSAGTDTGSVIATGSGALQYLYITRNFNSGSSLHSASPVTFYNSTVNFNNGATFHPAQVEILNFANVDFSTGSTHNFSLLSLGDNSSYATLTGSDTLQISGSLNLHSGELGGSGLFRTLSGSTTVLADTGTVVLSRNWDNEGTINWSAGGEFDTGISGASFNNQVGGVFNVGDPTLSGNSIMKMANFTNAGSMQISSGVLDIRSDTFTQTGAIDLTSGVSLIFANGFTNDGSITGAGTLDVHAGSLINNGSITPGNSPGTLNIIGDYTQTASGFLNLELNNNVPGNFDVLNVTGAASLDGILNLSGTGSPGGYSVISADTVTGTFAVVNQIGLTAVATYNPNEVIFSIGGIFWDGGASTFLWTDAANWSTNNLPSGTDIVTIGALASAVVLDSGAQSIKQLTSDADFMLSGGSLTVGANGAVFNGEFTLSGGTLAGSGDYQFLGGFNYSAGSVAASGRLQIAQNGNLSLPAMPNLSSLLATASGNLQLLGSISASGSNEAIVLATTGGSFLNPGMHNLNTPAGKWLVYAVNPTHDDKGGLNYAFKQYAWAYSASSYTGLGTGNGFIYSMAPEIVVSLVGNVNKAYDGTAAASLTTGNYDFSGALDGDVALLSYPLNGSYADHKLGTAKQVTVTGLNLVSVSNGAAPVYGYSLHSSSSTAPIGQIGYGQASWTGAGGDALWSNPLNWSITAVPDVNYDIFINTGAPLITFNADAGVHNIVSNDPVLLANGQLTLTGTAAFNNGFSQSGGLIAGNGAIGISGNFNWLGGSLNNTGGVTVNGNALLMNSVRLNTTLTALNGIDQQANLNLGANGRFVSNGFTNRGVLSGVGQIDVGSGTLWNEGDIAPGNSPGTLQINGNLSLAASSSVLFELYAPSSGNYDRLLVSGLLSLDGALRLSGLGLSGNYPILNSDWLSGRFRFTDFGGLPINMFYSANALMLSSGYYNFSPLAPENQQILVSANNISSSSANSGGAYSSSGGNGLVAYDLALGQGLGFFDPPTGKSGPTLTEPAGTVGGGPGEFGGDEDMPLASSTQTDKQSKSAHATNKKIPSCR